MLGKLKLKVRYMKRILQLFSVLCLSSCQFQQPFEIEGAPYQWQPITITFTGPELSEYGNPNPFSDYRLMVQIENRDTIFQIPGYFAADGNAGASGAHSGDQWKVHFTPNQPGLWRFKASFQTAPGLAIKPDSIIGQSIAFDGAAGRIEIAPADTAGSVFSTAGRIHVNPDNQYFQFAGSGNYFIKAGADSPENFLAYHEFDSTYRHNNEARAGEAAPSAELHQYRPHLEDWKDGDPVWHQDKGKGIIGAINYLAKEQMNAIYFLVMNINGDGKDVWPYLSHTDRDRFDCSKLDQWNIVFQHMQDKGILLHLVTQETENEKLLDNGDTGNERKLFYRELVARFGHHNGLVWNLGEENGPASFTPDGQTNDQQKAMASYLKAVDPYNHPVFLHTHSWKAQKDTILDGLLGFQDIDGLSFQVDQKSHVHEEILRWRQKSKAAGHPWSITMDEIGMWHTGVVPDKIYPRHDTMRQQVLWGSLMAGAAGVEWYFGANYAHNDLNCEDWRSRKYMWHQTRYAINFFQQYLDVEEMNPSDHLINQPDAFCLANPGHQYVVYFPKGTAGSAALDLEGNTIPFTIKWYNPRTGEALEDGSVTAILGPGPQKLGLPGQHENLDWVALIERKLN